MGRHRHAVTVRADGLGTVLGPLQHDPRVRAAALVDVGSGMVLDGWSHGGADPELVSAAAAELVRIAVGMLGAAVPEVVVRLGGSWHLVVLAVPDQRDGPLALSVVVNGPRRAVERARRRLRRVPVAALNAGPSMSRRPVDGMWTLLTETTVPGATAPPAVVEPERPSPARRLGGLRAAPWPTPMPVPPAAPLRPAPPSALPPARRVP